MVTCLAILVKLIVVPVLWKFRLPVVLEGPFRSIESSLRFALGKAELRQLLARNHIGISSEMSYASTQARQHILFTLPSLQLLNTHVMIQFDDTFPP
jgi:hypothetical protein